MRKLGIIIFCGLLSSCAWFESPEVQTQKMVAAELESINWNDVDQYPLFLDCDETVPKAVQRACFERTLLKHFSEILSEFEFELANDVADTLYVDFLVDKTGAISVLDMEENAAIRNQIPEFNGVIIESLKSLPKLEPALKRGIPVSAKFRVPIILNTKH
ncbi:hypothetical protein PP178_01715 [Zeaxanthinibacter sp. PT1]|uniref:hypothetical protein n=1 Tax=Zeaxanthinibacter TaxID=561554 RepID=UPI00234A666D|nr:hypothetical protein [Zeaxanthinibacter sp. PT1]MDC6350253.1 hypothetical protein [Zeaxanthinibacter sp. PT1]